MDTKMINTEVGMIARGSLTRAARSLLIWVGFPVMAVVANAQLVTSFENDEGFLAGQPAQGNGGWTGSNAFVVTNAQSKDGSQSVVADSSSQAGFLAISDLEATQVSSWFMNTVSTTTGWAYYSRFFAVVDSTNYQFAIRHHGVSADTPIAGAYVHFQGGSAANQMVYVGDKYNLQDWNNIVFKIDTSNMQYHILLNGEVVATSALVGGATEDSLITGFDFRRPSVGSVYYDLVEVPEVSHIALALGVFGLLFIAWRRKAS